MEGWLYGGVEVRGQGGWGERNALPITQPTTQPVVSRFLKVVDRIEGMQLPGPGRQADAMRAYSQANTGIYIFYL